MKAIQSVQLVLSHYPSDCRSRKIQSLGSAGGFSGAEFWKVLSPRGPLCLRKWPKEHPSQSRIDFIHRLLEHVVKKSFTLVPAPIGLDTGSPHTYLQHEGHFWELARWMPGRADYQENPSTEKLKAAAQALAAFHKAASSFISPSPHLDIAPTVQERLAQATSWIQGDLAQLEKYSNQSQNIEIQELPQWNHLIVDQAKRHIDDIRSELNSLRDCRVPIQACIRDIWHQHILYCGEGVSGVIDFGAARPDTVVTDLVRLLGSLAVSNKSKWKCGLEAYESICPLNPQERLLVGPLDRSAVLLSGLNWLRWLYVEKRNFSNETAVAMRLKQIVSRLGK